MPLTRERPRTPVFPPPAPLPSLSDALARRAAVFGPFDLDDAPVAPRGSWQAVGRAARRVADLLDPVGR
ncbi:hypothetical protein D3273_13340 [Lichenibacterium minor]|uniref:Uncharacterized protein n=1 Tax=Lichenibacterium minor TaxID=2316528 RepID=A0A4Q2U686_9HYPH|nr:hypothetical protein [Lichenibacterium minor]RYC31368.1 hypothetical protein D3273_13340 [Lichenibacterium minor]